ncbi:hypothetical protein ACFYW6_38595 [Streptomyces sp. NPDC002659]|uniref:hypothetical protein n=1 Tax=Streptomyces sp. NPDC002659 TaxID=3364656 RepID=UPI00369D14BF
MTKWNVLVPPRLYEEFAHLSAGGGRVVHEVLNQLAYEPRDPASSTEPIAGVELRRITTAPAPTPANASCSFTASTRPRAAKQPAASK